MRRRIRVVLTVTLAIGLGVSALTGAGSTASADDHALTTGDFSPLALAGFSEVVDGTDGLVPSGLGGPDQAFIWSMAEFDGALFVGTGTIPSGNLLELPADERNRYRGEIWRYDWAGPDGADGTWTQVYRSPLLHVPGFLPGGVPRYFGFRAMAVCDGRLWVAGFGTTPRILMSSDGHAFGTATTAGLPGDHLGFRALECLDGHLVTSPIGAGGNPDVAPSPPLVFANDDPMSRGWTQINHPGFGDTDNLAVFSMATWDRDGDGVEDTIAAATTNRTTGAQVWVNTDPCVLTTCAGAKDSWDMLVSYGAGRPQTPPWVRIDTATSLGAIPDWGPHNAGAAWMTEFEGDLWVAFSEAASGGSGAGLGELVRVRRDGTFELVTGLPRTPWPGYNAPADFSDLAVLGGTTASYAALDIASGDITTTTFFTDGPDVAIPYPLAGNPCDPVTGPTNPACRPSGDKGLGQADAVDPAAEPPGFSEGDHDALIADLYADLDSVEGVDLTLPSPISADWEAIHPLVRLWIGYTRLTETVRSGYIWHLTVHDGRLYTSGLDRSAGRDGFDILSTAGGPSPTFDVVIDDGFGDPGNSGGRSMLSTERGLVVGTLDLSERRGLPGGGGDVWLGS